MAESQDAIRLHLGCGTNKLDGWVNIDAVESCEPDVVHDISKTLPYDDQSVDEIIAEDLLEHFDKYMRCIVFADWVRVLKVGGLITLQVPNIKKILLSYFKLGFNGFIDSMFGENMLRSDVYIGHYGNHKWGYSKDTLVDFASRFGVVPLEVKRKGLNIHFVGKKQRHVPVEELDKIMIYSHANDKGIGDAYMSLAAAKEKINKFQGESKEK